MSGHIPYDDMDEIPHPDSIYGAPSDLISDGSHLVAHQSDGSRLLVSQQPEGSNQHTISFRGQVYVFDAVGPDKGTLRDLSKKTEENQLLLIKPGEGGSFTDVNNSKSESANVEQDTSLVSLTNGDNYIARARDAAAAQIARVPTGPNYATLICGPASTMPLTRYTYPDISTFIPNFTTTFYYLNSMDHLMTATKRWTDNCLGWVPPFSQVYIGMLCYIQTMRAMQAAGLLTPTSEISILLVEFTRRFPLQNLWIPGPLVSLFKSIAYFKPSDIFGNVSPTLPTSPGWSRARRFRINDATSSHLPNINIFISRINSVCAAASRLNATNDSFLRDVDGPRFMANLFSQPCNHDDANEQANLISPGSSLAYSGNLKLWQDASSSQLLLDVAADEVADNWTSFLGLSSNSNWFGSVTAMMAKYCQFWKGSLPLYDCSPASSAAGSVRCITTKTDIYTPPMWNAQRGNHTSFSHDDANQSSHYTMRPNFHLTFQAATSLVDIPLAHYYSALTYNINMVRSVDDLAAVTHGPFWDIHPDSLVRSGIQIYPGINALLARDYHSDTPIESERQNV